MLQTSQYSSKMSRLRKIRKEYRTVQIGGENVIWHLNAMWATGSDPEKSIGGTTGEIWISTIDEFIV